MKKIIIIGCPGAGKSTFARRLHDKTGIALFYLDMIWHKADKTNVSREEFDAKLREIMKEEEWILDGNYLRTIPMRLEQCDTVFFLDYPLDVCLEGAKSRIGKEREEMPWVETELDEEFRQWILDFPETSLPQIYEMLREYPQKDIHIFKSREEAEKFFLTLP